MSEFQEPAKSDALLIAALQWIEKNAAVQPLEQRIDVSFTRGATELDLLARCFSGLQFTDMRYSDDLDRDPGEDHVHIYVSGAGADLVRHGFLNADQLASIANCKARKVLREVDGSCIEVDRRAAGFRVRRRVPLGTIAAVLAPHVWSPKFRSIL